MNQHPQKSGELKAARTVADKLILAVKNTSFYPADHAVVRESLSGLAAALSDFVSQFGPLVLEVCKTHLEYCGQQLSPGTELHETLAYTCYRDGIEFLSFSENFETSELEVFIRILSHRRLLEDENEGDMVTDLWEAGFSNIRYATNNRLWQNEALLDISSLKVSGNVVNQSGGTETAPDENRPPDPALWRLAPEEIDATRRMVEEEENRHFDQDVFGVFLVILRQQRDREDFVTVLDIIRQCFRRTLARGEFRSAARFLFNLEQVRHQYDVAHHWALPYLDDFLLMVSGPKELSVLSDILPKISGRNTEALRDLKNLLVRLSPESILAMGKMLVNVRNSPVRRVIIGAIRELSTRDPRPLYQLTRNESSAVARQAIAILGRLGQKAHLPVIIETTRSFKPAVRIAGVEALLCYDPPEYERLLPFMFDENEQVRQKVFDFLAGSRRADAEAALLKFLQQESFAPNQRGPMLLLYRALGACGSEQSLGFLKNRLTARPWGINKIRSMHRQGAALSLMAHAHPDASDILAKAYRTIWPSIRRAGRKAREFKDGNRHRIG